MNIAYSWLQSLLSFDLSPAETAVALTSIGLENGPLEEVETIKGGLEGLLIGQVITCEPHPNSDHLHLTTVDVGTGELLPIVCGAPNVAAGQKVVVATVGTKLYSGEESFTIKRSKIRGAESMGMICAEDEIGLGTSHDGIIVLPEDALVGQPASEYYGISKEFVLEVDITPNRADAASHFGVVRDLAAYLRQTNPAVKLERPSVEAFAVDNHDYPVAVTLENPEACLRYAGITLTNVKVAESPKWLKDRLSLIGVRPINNVVDVTNYLLHEMGQPLHAFDGASIKGDQVRVRMVDHGTHFITLDGVERTLDGNDLMICNATEPMCIGGVFGGLDSGVTEATSKVFLESACFSPVHIRKTARRHGLNTDASFRFERGVDPNAVVYVLKRAALMIKALTGASISSEIVDIYPEPLDGFKVELSLDKVNRLIGKELSKETVLSILDSLEIIVEADKGDLLSLLVPAYRVDVQRDVDVIEDILRIYGYNRVEFTDTMRSTIVPSVKPDNHSMQHLVSEQLTANGFNEILTNSLTAASYYTSLTSVPESHCVRLLNPLSNELSVMRQTLLFGGLESIAYNRNRRKTDLRFYEFGNCYHYDADVKREGDVLSAYSEEMHLGIWMTGCKQEQHWSGPQVKFTVYDLKAAVHSIFVRLGVRIDQCVLTEGSSDLLAHDLTYTTKNGAMLATLGQVQPGLLKSFDIDVPVFFADVRWDVLLGAVRRHTVQFTELPRYPEVRRDLALLVDEHVRFETIEQIAFATERKLLRTVTLFDVYEGKNLPAGKKSYAVSFVLQDLSQTLTEDKIDAVMGKLIKQYEQHIGASLR
jgi:phenylalanyl-tRNA synthetase beta chain